MRQNKNTKSAGFGTFRLTSTANKESSFMLF